MKTWMTIICRYTGRLPNHHRGSLSAQALMNPKKRRLLFKILAMRLWIGERNVALANNLEDALKMDNTGEPASQRKPWSQDLRHIQLPPKAVHPDQRFCFIHHLQLLMTRTSSRGTTSSVLLTQTPRTRPRSSPRSRTSRICRARLNNS